MVAAATQQAAWKAHPENPWFHYQADAFAAWVRARVPGTLERVLQASEEIVRLCVEAGGSLSGEHGIGLEKRDFMPLVFSEDDLTAQACVRAAFDPEGRMNPHKVLPAGARCGDYAMLRGDDATEAVRQIWLIRPDGSKAWTWDYFYGLLNPDWQKKFGSMYLTHRREI